MGWDEFRRDPRDVSYVSRVSRGPAGANSTAKRAKATAAPRDTAFFSRGPYENSSRLFSADFAVAFA